MQVLPSVPSFGEQIGRSLGSNLTKGFSEHIIGQQEKKQRLAALNQEDKEIEEATGIKMPRGMIDPEMRKQYFTQQLQGKSASDLQNVKGQQALELQGLKGQQENEKYENELKENDKVLRDLEHRRELESGSLSAYRRDPKMAEQTTRPAKPKGAVGGLGGTPLTPEEAAKIREVVNSNPNASAEELELAFNEAHVPPGRYEKILESRRRTEESKASNQFQKDKFEREEEAALSKPVLLELNEIRRNIPLQEQAILDIQEATPNLSPLDYIADVTGFEPFRSSSGAKLKTAVKDFFLSDLTRVGARPNQWIEQQLLDALPKFGRDIESNLITAEGMKFKVDLAKKRAEVIDELAEKDRKKYGYVKGDVDSRASKEMKRYVIDRQKELKENIEKIKSKTKGESKAVLMLSPDGSLYEILPDDIDEALENEFTFQK